MKSYDTYIKKWQEFVDINKIVSPSHVDLANFLAGLYKTGVSHSTINLARSAVSAYLNKPGSDSVGSHPVVCRLLKGVFEKRPSLPRYMETWDVDVVLDSLVQWPQVETMQLRELTLRTVMLLALLSGQRGQSLHSLLVDDIKLKDNKCIIVYSAVLKQTRVGTHVPPLELQGFENKKLCIVTHLKDYILRTEKLRQGRQLFISYVQPHKPISRDTLSRWIKCVLEQAGIDITKFSAHSTRSASTSAAFARDVSLANILNTAGWSNANTFSKFYCKPVTQKPKSLAQSVLDKFVNKTA